MAYKTEYDLGQSAERFGGGTNTIVVRSYCTMLSPSNFGGIEYTLGSFIYERNSDGTYACVGIGDVDLNGIVIPEKHNDQPVTAIGVGAFQGLKTLTSVKIPASVTTIRQDAFHGCSALTKVEFLGDGLVTIDKSAFASCTSLTNITLPETVETIDEGAFSYCKTLSSIHIPSSVKTIGYSAFGECAGLESVTFGENSGISTIPEYAFANCTSLASITIPDSVSAIKNYAFVSCSKLASVNDPESLTTIGLSAFRGAALETVNFSYLEYIGDLAFKDCSKLNHVFIPSSIKRIGKEAFKSCTSLNSIFFRNPYGWYYTANADYTEGVVISHDIIGTDGIIIPYLIGTSTAPDGLPYSSHYFYKINRLPAPEVELRDGSILVITDTSGGHAESYKIYINGDWDNAIELPVSVV